MATQKTVVEIDIQGTEKVESMRSQMRRLREELAQLPEGTDEFKKVQRQLAELKDKVDDLNMSVNTLAGDPLERLNNSFSSVGSSLMSLDFGAAIIGLNGMSSAIKEIKFKDVANGIKSIGGAFANVGKALLTNPIFLVAAALALIIMNFEKIIKLFPSMEKGLTGISEAEREAATAAQERAEASDKAYKSIDQQSNILKLQGKTEREILDIKLKQLSITIRDRKAQLVIQQEQAKVQIETAERNRKILEGAIAWILGPLDLMLLTVDLIGKAFGKEWDLRNKLNASIASTMLDPEETKAELEATIEQNKDAIATMENDYAGLQLSIKAMDAKKQEEDRSSQVKKERETTKFELESLASREAQKLEVSKQAGLSLNKISEDLAKSRAATQLLIDQENQKRRLEGEKAFQEAKYRIAADAIGGLMDLNSALVDSGIVDAKKGFEIAKTLGIAQATISTIEGTQNAFTTAQASPITTVFPAYPFIQAGIAAAAGIARIASIRAQQFNGGGNAPKPSGNGGGSSMGGSSSAPAVDLSFLNVNGNKAQPIQTYVLATNVSSAQEAEQKIKDQSKIIK
jgi:hypothetical protein